MTAPYTRLTAALADRYRLERELGQGGMATVYLAEDLKHHRKVATKVLKPDLAAAVGAAADEVAWLVQYGPQVPYTWQLQALVAALQGDRARALETLARVNTAPLDFHLTFHLAESFAMAGDTARALCPFMAPLRGSPEYERITEKARGRWEDFGREVAR